MMINGMKDASLSIYNSPHGDLLGLLQEEEKFLTISLITYIEFDSKLS